MGENQTKEIKPITTIIPHKQQINLVSTFKSGNIISISNDKSIIIYNMNLNIIQKIENAHYNNIYGLSIKDDKNFITCSDDLSIKIWKKRYLNKYDISRFFVNGIIYNCHTERIYDVVYYSNENFISCSGDKTIKIWGKKKYKNFQLITIIKNSWKIFSLLFLEDKNILIASQVNGLNFYDVKIWKNLFSIKETCCGFWNCLKRIDDDRIILGGINLSIYIISIKEKTIIKIIKNELHNWGIFICKKRGIFFVGEDNNIKIFNINNYKCIKKIENAHDNIIYGFCELNDGKILSYSADKKIKIWVL